MHRRFVVSAVLGALVGVGSLALRDAPRALAQDEAKPQEAAAKQDQARQMPDIVKGLKETPGCLGVETARTPSGKNLVFAWFENKQAAMAWYKSPTHKFYMNMMGGGGRPPMTQVPDDGKPILCIASITPSQEQKIEGAPMNISQISIELYSVAPGGASVGGTFAPATLKIPNHHKYDDDAEGEAAAAASDKP